MLTARRRRRRRRPPHGCGHRPGHRHHRLPARRHRQRRRSRDHPRRHRSAGGYADRQRPHLGLVAEPRQPGRAQHHGRRRLQPGPARLRVRSRRPDRHHRPAPRGGAWCRAVDQERDRDQPEPRRQPAGRRREHRQHRPRPGRPRDRARRPDHRKRVAHARGRGGGDRGRDRHRPRHPRASTRRHPHAERGARYGRPSAASLVADLDLSLCTADRNPGDVCTAEVAAIELPFNLALGTTGDATGIAGLDASGTVDVSFDARAHLELGVQLPQVIAAAGPGLPPVVTGTPSLFLVDGTSFEIGVGAALQAQLGATLGPVHVSLGSGGEPITGGLAARFRLARPGTHRRPPADHQPRPHATPGPTTPPTSRRAARCPAPTTPARCCPCSSGPPTSATSRSGRPTS